jgi:Fic family protein
VSSLTDGELDSLLLVWEDQKGTLEESGALQVFLTRLKREWAIETGIIEGVYTLDRGTTQALIEHGINAALIPHGATDRSPELVALIIHDHEEALEGIFSFVKGDRPLTVGYIKELHAALLKHQDVSEAVDQFGNPVQLRIEKGVYKKHPNNPTRLNGFIHEYCPPEHVAAEMDRMVALHAEHMSRKVPPEIEAAWLHHVFTQIHPFQDGNGRVARALATAVFLRAGWFPFAVLSKERAEYIKALEIADAGDLFPLVSQFARVQRRSLLAAVEAWHEIKPPRTIDEEIAAARDKLAISKQISNPAWVNAKETVKALSFLTAERFYRLAETLEKELSSLSSDLKFKVGSGHGFVSIGPQSKRAEPVVELELGRKPQKIVVSFFDLGVTFRGLCGALLNFDGDFSSEVFQINYREPADVARRRFESWLEENLVPALAAWRRSL